jgi:hypothetical protein
MKEEPQPSMGLAPKGHAAKSVSKRRESYKHRVDFCCAISLDGPLACNVMLPEDRKREEVSGYNKDLLLDFVTEELSGPIRAMKPRTVVVCLDKGLRVTPEEVMEELKDAGATNVRKVLIMPTNAGKVTNPLDNAMWADVKRRVRERKPKTVEEVGQVFEEEFYNTPAAKIRGWYRLSGVLPGSDVNRDL